MTLEHLRALRDASPFHDPREWRTVFPHSAQGLFVAPS
jgi:hypothetical protein